MDTRRSFRAQRAARTREALLNAAAREIGRRGYTAARIDDIAAAAGMTKGAFYTHFPDKAAVLTEVLVRWTEDRGRRVAGATTFAEAVAALADYRCPADAALPAEFWRCSLRDGELRARLIEAYRAWAGDLERLAEVEPSLRVAPRDAALAALALHDGVVASMCADVSCAGVAPHLTASLRAQGGARRTA